MDLMTGMRALDLGDQEPEPVKTLLNFPVRVARGLF